MTEFVEEVRHRCRHQRCRMKLPAPVSNPHEAFCTRGCHTSFYRKRCLVCEGPLDRKNSTQKVCRKSKCRRAFRAGLNLGRYMQSSSASLASKTLDFIDSKTLIKPDRTGPTPWLQKHLAKPTTDGAWRWEQLPGEDDDWQLLDRGGRMVARVRQEGDGYWVTRPRTTPEPPIESFETACRRAVETAMTLAWPDSERHAIHPGMTASQFEVTCRDLFRKYPDWSAKEIRDHITGILKSSVRQDCLIKYDSAPVNIIGGYRFPGAPIVDLSPIEPTSKLSPQMGVVSSTVVSGDGLDIPEFLRRTVAATKPQAAEREN